MTERLSDAEVEKLIRIADASIKERKRHWYAFGMPVDHHYNLDEQLDAIRKLGASRNQLALDYVAELDKTDDVQVDAFKYVGFHPNAKGRLYRVLCYTHIGFDKGMWHRRHLAAEAIIDEALLQLKKSL